MEKVLEKMLNSNAKIEIKLMDKDYILVFVKVPVSRYLTPTLEKLSAKTSKNKLIYGKVVVENIENYSYMVGIATVKEANKVSEKIQQLFNKIMSIIKNAKLLNSK